MLVHSLSPSWQRTLSQAEILIDIRPQRHTGMKLRPRAPDYGVHPCSTADLQLYIVTNQLLVFGAHITTGTMGYVSNLAYFC